MHGSRIIFHRKLTHNFTASPVTTALIRYNIWARQGTTAFTQHSNDGCCFPAIQIASMIWSLTVRVEGVHSKKRKKGSFRITMHPWYEEHVWLIFCKPKSLLLYCWTVQILLEGLNQLFPLHRGSPTRNSMLLKTVAHNTDVIEDGWKWNICCTKNIFGSRCSRWENNNGSSCWHNFHFLQKCLWLSSVLFLEFFYIWLQIWNPVLLR